MKILPDIQYLYASENQAARDMGEVGEWSQLTAEAITEDGWNEVEVLPNVLDISAAEIEAVEIIYLPLTKNVRPEIRQLIL